MSREGYELYEPEDDPRLDIDKGYELFKKEEENFKQLLKTEVHKLLRKFETRTGHAITNINISLVNYSEIEGDLSQGDMNISYIEIATRRF